MKCGQLLDRIDPVQGPPTSLRDLAIAAACLGAAADEVPSPEAVVGRRTLIEWERQIVRVLALVGQAPGDYVEPTDEEASESHARVFFGLKDGALYEIRDLIEQTKVDELDQDGDAA